MNVGELNAYLRLNSGQFSTGLMAAQGQLGKFGGVAGQVFKTAAKVAAVAIGAISAALLKGVADAAKFEKQLAQVSTMLDKGTMKYMTDYRKGLSAMSQMFGESTETLSKGLYDILSASIDASKALDVLAVSAVAAKAGLTDTGTAADALTTLINAYGLSADKAGYLSDVLFSTVKYGKTTFAELAPVIGTVATTAAKVGVSVEELGSMFAVLTRNGLNSHLAATALRGTLTGLLKPSDEAIATAKQLGIEWGIQAVEAKGLSGTLDQLAGLPPDVITKLFPNVRGLTGALIATGKLTDEVEKFGGILSDGSATIDAYNKNTDTLAHNWDQLKQTIVATSRRIGDTAMPEFRKFVNTIIYWLQGEGGQAIEDFFKKVVDWIIEVIPKLVNFANTVRNVFQFIIGILKPVYDAWWEMFRAVVDGLVEVVTELFSFSGDTGEAFDQIQNFLKSGLVAFMMYYKGVTFAIKVIIDWIKTYVEAVKSVGGMIAAVFRGDWEAAKESAKNIGTAFKDLGSDIKEDWEDTLGTVPETVDRIFGVSNLTLEDLQSSVGNFFKDAQELSAETLALFEHDEEGKTTATEEGNKDRTDIEEETAEERAAREQDEWEAFVERTSAETQAKMDALAEQQEIEAISAAGIRDIREKEHQDELDRIEKEKEEQKKKADYIKSLSRGLYNTLGDVIDQYYTNQLAYIDATVTDEKEAAQKKYDIQVKQFRARKLESIVNTVISTAGAVMKAFEQLGPIGGAIATAFIVGLGAAKVALIASQKPPPAPTFYRGGEVEAGVLRGRSGVDQNMIAATAGEYIMPPAQTAANINELEAMRRGENRPIAIQPGTVILSLDGREIARATVPYLENEYDSGRARVNPRAVRAG